MTPFSWRILGVRVAWGLLTLTSAYAALPSAEGATSPIRMGCKQAAALAALDAASSETRGGGKLRVVDNSVADPGEYLVNVELTREAQSQLTYHVATQPAQTANADCRILEIDLTRE